VLYRKRCKKVKQMKYYFTPRANNAYSDDPVPNLHGKPRMSYPKVPSHSTIDDDKQFLKMIDRLATIDDFHKDLKTPKWNTLADHYNTSSTQTEMESEINRRTVFGERYEHRYLLTKNSACIQLPASDVIMTLPRKELMDHPIEVYGSSFDNIAAIRKKMAIPDDLDLASPVVEYAITGNQVFIEYAVVQLPFIGASETLKVWKFKSDEGLHQVTKSVEVPLKDKLNVYADMFYTLQGIQRNIGL